MGAVGKADTQKSEHASRGSFRRTWRFSRVVSLGFALLALLVAARMALPFALRWAINRRLNRIPSYQGHVEDVHVALWRGVYLLDGVRITKRNGAQSLPFFSAREIELGLAWRELFRRKIVGDVTIDRASLNFVRAGRSASPNQESQLDADRRWQDAVRSIFPLDITYVKISDSRVHYVDESANPVVDIFIDHLQALATGLRNRPEDEPGKKFPASLTLDGDSIGHGRLHVAVQAEPLAPQPHFELALQFTGVSLPALNNFLRAYGNVDVTTGTFQVYMEVAVRDGHYEGYAKPFFTNVKFTDLAKKDLGQKIWQALVSGFIDLFKNPARNQVASRIPFSGRFGRPNIGLWASFVTLFQDGFVKPLPEGLEHGLKAQAVSPANAGSSR